MDQDTKLTIVGIIAFLALIVAGSIAISPLLASEDEPIKATGEVLSINM